jgi:hypothetical protein
MENLRIIQPPEKEFSWTAEILKTPIGMEAKINKKYTKTVKPIISRDIKVKAPTAKFETDSTSDPKYFIIKRTA